MSALPGSRPKVFWLPLLDERPRKVVAVAALLFLAIFVLRFAATKTGDAITFLYVIPIALVAIAQGERGGLIAGALAFALSAFWAQVEGIAVGPLGYLVRAAVFMMVGSLVGRFASSIRALAIESGRHFELSRDMVATAGFDGYFKRVNPAFERTLGYSPEEMLSRPFIDFVHPDDRERTEEEAAALGEGSTTVQFQNRYFDKRGDVHWIEWTSIGVPEEDLIYGVARDVTDRKALEEELERLSRHDSLTGLINRRRFDEQLEAQLVYTRRYGEGGALLVLDLNRFKEINDELGHTAGDEALRTVADVLQRNLRQSDTVARAANGVLARLGGDEFAVLLPEADEAAAEAVAERLVEALAATKLTIEGRGVPLGISIGIALFDEHGCPPAQDLMVAADRAMYKAKAAGGGTSLAVPHG
jgi:diguanylate cyclase (GGDEF)-like protein/PAS domain S-box-containing protein